MSENITVLELELHPVPAWTGKSIRNLINGITYYIANANTYSYISTSQNDALRCIKNIVNSKAFTKHRCYPIRFVQTIYQRRSHLQTLIRKVSLSVRCASWRHHIWHLLCWHFRAVTNDLFRRSRKWKHRGYCVIAYGPLTNSWRGKRSSETVYVLDIDARRSLYCIYIRD